MRLLAWSHAGHFTCTMSFSLLIKFTKGVLLPPHSTTEAQRGYVATQLVSSRVRLTSRSVQFESLSRSPLEFGEGGWVSVKVCRMKLVMREAQRTCQLKGPGRLRCVISEPLKDEGREWRATLPSPWLGAPLLCMYIVSQKH